MAPPSWSCAPEASPPRGPRRTRGPGRGARGVSGRHAGRGAGGGASGVSGRARVGAARPAPCAPRRAPGPARRRHIWKRSERPPGARRAGGAAGRGVSAALRAPAGGSLSPPLQKQLLPERRAARPGAAAPSCLLALGTRRTFGQRKAEQGRGGRAESGRRRFRPAAGGPLPPWGPRSPLPFRLLSLCLPIYFFKCCGRQRCGAEFLEGARMC